MCRCWKHAGASGTWRAQMLSSSLGSPHLEAGERHHAFPLKQILQRSEAERKRARSSRLKADTTGLHVSVRPGKSGLVTRLTLVCDWSWAQCLEVKVSLFTGRRCWVARQPETIPHKVLSSFNVLGRSQRTVTDIKQKWKKFRESKSFKNGVLMLSYKTNLTFSQEEKMLFFPKC